MTRFRLFLCLFLLLALSSTTSLAWAQEIPQEYIHAGSSSSRFFHRVGKVPRAMTKGVRKTGRSLGRAVKAFGRGVSSPFRHKGPTFTTAEFPNDPYGGAQPAGSSSQSH